MKDRVECGPEEGVVFDAALPQVLAGRLGRALERVRILLLVAVLHANHEHLALERHLIQARPDVKQSTTIDMDINEIYSMKLQTCHV